MTNLTRDQWNALEQFAAMAISIEELRDRLRDVVEFVFREDGRTLTSHYLIPSPGIRIGLDHIRSAMARHASSEITTEELSDWATMLLMNDAYDWEGPDEDEIANWLNDISMLTLKPKSAPDP